MDNFQNNPFQPLCESEDEFPPFTPLKNKKKKREFEATPSKTIMNLKKLPKQQKGEETIGKCQNQQNNLQQILILLKQQKLEEDNEEIQVVLENTQRTIQNLLDFKKGEKPFFKSETVQKEKRDENQGQNDLGARIQRLEELVIAKLTPQPAKESQGATYASIASKNLDSQKILPKTTPPLNLGKQPKKSYIEGPKRLFIKVSKDELQNLQGFQIRNSINREFQKEMQIQNPVLSIVSKTYKEDKLVLVLMPEFSLEFLIENQQIWGPEIQSYFPSLQKDFQIEKSEKWFNLVIHGIPLSIFDCENGLDLLQEEIESYNPLFKNQFIKTPVWLSSKENRETKFNGSVLVSLKQKLESTGVLIGGKWLKIANYLPKESKRGSTQCYHCQKYGHSSFRCLNPPKCRFCAKNHNSQEHHCEICKVLGASCSHTLPKCSNCEERHFSTDSKCIFSKRNPLGKAKEGETTKDQKEEEIQQKETRQRKTLVPKSARKEVQDPKSVTSSSSSSSPPSSLPNSIGINQKKGKTQFLKAVEIPASEWKSPPIQISKW